MKGKERVETILELDYISVTEFIDLLKNLRLKYSRQGLGVMKRSGKELFQYDAVAFGNKFFRKEKALNIIDYICKSKGNKRTKAQIEKAFKKTIEKNRTQLN